MKQLKPIYDVIVIGSGPGGLAAAIAAKKGGADDVLVLERDVELGGILLQCIHNGFGMETFKEDLPGPGYAQRFVDEAKAIGVEYLLDTMVLDVTPDRRIFVMSSRGGLVELQARAIIMAMGCRERTRAQIRLPGPRPAGVYTAGTAQRWVNVEGYMPGKRFVILGSGDIGMIMARRLTFEGAQGRRCARSDALPHRTEPQLRPMPAGLRHPAAPVAHRQAHHRQGSRRSHRIGGSGRALAAGPRHRRDHPVRHAAALRGPHPGERTLAQGRCGARSHHRRAVRGRRLPDERARHLRGGQRRPRVRPGRLGHAGGGDGGEAGGAASGDHESRITNHESRITNRIRITNYVPTRAGENVRYVVPHKVDPETLTEDAVMLQMRVTRPLEQPVRVEVYDGETLITRKNERYARPGEMVNVTLRGRDYDAVRQAKALTVAVVPR